MKTEMPLLVKESVNGKGVFANKAFKKGDLLLEFHGKTLSYKELPPSYNETEDHYVQIGKDTYMGPSGGTDDFINHSCDPNAGLKINDLKVVLVSIKDINIGEEITWDYSTTMNEDDWEMDCNCGAKECRKRIRDFKYLPKHIQEKYLSLGIVPKYCQ